MTASTPLANAEIVLTDPAGRASKLGEYRADLLVVILVRYFGCLPCQEYLRALDRARDRFSTGTRVVAVGGSAGYQARWLRDTKGVRMPLLLDPDHQVRAVAGVGNLTSLQLSRLDGWKNYFRAMRHGFRPQVPTADLRKAPGIVVFDAKFSVMWVHRGETLGDYPPLDELLERLGSLAPSS